MRQRILRLLTVAIISGALLALSALGPLTARAQTGRLVRTADNAAVYYVTADDRLQVFPNEDVFFSWYPDFAAVEIITPDALQALGVPQNNITMRAGTYLVKRPLPNAPEVYAVEPGGVLRLIPSEEVARALYGGAWTERVVDVPDAFFVDYHAQTAHERPVSADSWPAGSLIRLADGALYYVSIDGVAQPVADTDTLRANRFQDVYVITHAEVLPPAMVTAINALQGEQPDLIDTAEQAVKAYVADSSAQGSSITEAVAGITERTVAEALQFAPAPVVSGGGGGGGGGGGTSSPTPAPDTTDDDEIPPQDNDAPEEEEEEEEEVVPPPPPPEPIGVTTGNIDVDVLYISRTPRYERYDLTYQLASDGLATISTVQNAAVQHEPVNGETVTFTAYIANKGEETTASGTYEWFIDGVSVAIGEIPPLEASSSPASLSYEWVWADDGDHTVSFVADSANELTETSETNNTRTDNIDAYFLRMHVEQGVYDAFHNYENIAGTYSFEDWLQAHADEMNRLLAAQDSSARIRLDEIIVEPDDTLPNGGEHAPLDLAWDGRWGFENDEWTLDKIETWYDAFEYPLIHEWTHQLGVIDEYNLNYDWNYAVDNEVMPGCTSHDLSVHGTAPEYAHCVYANDRLQGLMNFYSGEPFYSWHTLYGLEATLGYRRGYFGEYMYRLPQTNYLQILDASGSPLASSTVEVYQGTKWAIPLDSLIVTATTTDDGTMLLPNRTVDIAEQTQTGFQLQDNPFGNISVPGFNGIFAIKVTFDGQEYYEFLDITEFNYQYSLGNHDEATYVIETDIDQ